MNIKAKRLVFSLVSASRDQTVSAAEVIAASELFGVAASNTRVILLRLVADGVLQQKARGIYGLSASSRRLADEIRLWRTKESRVRPWRGDYAVVMSEKTRRLDLKARRQRTHALRLMGFRSLESEIHVRPNNLESTLPHLRQRLHALGLETSAAVFAASDFDAAMMKKIHKLWDCASLNQGYCEETAKLQRWLDQVDQSDVNSALRDSYVLGASAIRVIAFDPMLPEGMVDSEARKRLIETACRVDDIGHALWMRFLEGRTRARIRG